MVKHMKSIEEKIPINVNFINESTGPMKLFHLDRKGNLQMKASIEPGTRVNVNTFATNTWLLKEKFEYICLYNPQKTLKPNMTVNLTVTPNYEIILDDVNSYHDNEMSSDHNIKNIYEIKHNEYDRGHSRSKSFHNDHRYEMMDNRNHRSKSRNRPYNNKVEHPYDNMRPANQYMVPFDKHGRSISRNRMPENRGFGQNVDASFSSDSSRGNNSVEKHISFQEKPNIIYPDQNSRNGARKQYLQEPIIYNSHNEAVYSQKDPYHGMPRHQVAHENIYLQDKNPKNVPTFVDVNTPKYLAEPLPNHMPNDSNLEYREIFEKNRLRPEERRQRNEKYLDRPNESHHRPNKSHHRPNKSHHRPNESHHRPYQPIQKKHQSRSNSNYHSRSDTSNSDEQDHINQSRKEYKKNIMLDNYDIGQSTFTTYDDTQRNPYKYPNQDEKIQKSILSNGKKSSKYNYEDNLNRNSVSRESKSTLRGNFMQIDKSSKRHVSRDLFDVKGMKMSSPYGPVEKKRPISKSKYQETCYF